MGLLHWPFYRNFLKFTWKVDSKWNCSWLLIELYIIIVSVKDVVTTYIIAFDVIDECIDISASDAKVIIV